ncbi:outer membrane protein [Bartonella sp. CB175]|uniref:outer membrane protein n=1 Tax=Bartonella sp. CB175 TaxID=3112256 RepID=UPI00300DF129
MNTKYLMAVSVFAMVSSSVAQAADVRVPYQSEHMVSPVIAPSTFSWTGFYFGGQIGAFSSKISATAPDSDIPLAPNERDKHKKWISIEKKYLPELSGFIGGFYAGANVDLGNNFILGVDTDVILSERKGTKTIFVKENEENRAFQLLRENQREAEEDHITFKHTLKQQWTGATRVRVGFAAGCVMPYVSGGVAYGHFQDILSVSVTGAEVFNAKLDDKQTMIGYTLGGGVDFAITDHVIARAEYRHSDFGKKKFGDAIELDYKTNDFRVGVAYKF